MGNIQYMMGRKTWQKSPRKHCWQKYTSLSLLCSGPSKVQCDWQNTQVWVKCISKLCCIPCRWPWETRYPHHDREKFAVHVIMRRLCYVIIIVVGKKTHSQNITRLNQPRLTSSSRGRSPQMFYHPSCESKWVAGLISRICPIVLESFDLHLRHSGGISFSTPWKIKSDVRKSRGLFFFFHNILCGIETRMEFLRPIITKLAFISRQWLHSQVGFSHVRRPRVWICLEMVMRWITIGRELMYFMLQVSQM